MFFEISVAFIDSCTNLLSKRPPDMIFDMPASRGSILLPCSEGVQEAGQHMERLIVQMFNVQKLISFILLLLI